MMYSSVKYLSVVAIAVTFAAGGSGDSGSEADPLAGMQSAFTHKMMQATGENRFAVLGYECQECTWE